jgi:hypothetical protein
LLFFLFLLEPDVHVGFSQVDTGDTVPSIHVTPIKNGKHTRETIGGVEFTEELKERRIMDMLMAIFIQKLSPTYPCSLAPRCSKPLALSWLASRGRLGITLSTRGGVQTLG